ncbi:sterol desaturase family protein [Ruegeria sp. PrR005]|uniref:Sterol desaturase family protein n=1 Tax=Ruegeria sp. PrR005 TaxID=2706882 RepID=A0A6B2NN64_9RHOB|nr:sterol desaturase family protein [Ruegeria sp. PrR005]
MDTELIRFVVEESLRIVQRYLFFAAGAFGLFYLLLRRAMWPRKIQKRWPRLTDYGRDLVFSLISVGIFAVISSLIFFVFRDQTNIYGGSMGSQGWGYLAFTFVWMLVLHDTYFYWVHRLMHTRALYRHVHLVHHRSTNPSPWTAYAFHPIEAVLEVGILPIIAFTLPVHWAAVMYFFIFQIAYNVYGHLGFELYPRGFHKHWLGRWINTSVAHNQHHGRFTGNYGLYFLFWDRVMGTLRSDYDATYVATTGAETPGAVTVPR